MKKLIPAGLIIAALLSSAVNAQRFPTVPANTAIGRLGSGSGPSRAIPFSTLLPAMAGVQSANQVYAGPSSGSAASPAFRSLVGADLPNPSASTLGGIESITCATHQWLSSISIAGVPACTQPAASDISGGAALTSANDTNVTIVLAGTPAASLLAATSITLGWTGTLAVSRGGTGGSSASGTLLDNITGFASTGFLKRTGAGTYTFITDPLPVANGGTGDTGTAWTTFTPAFACGTGTFTVNSARTKTIGKTVFLSVDVTIATVGTCTTTPTFTLPSSTPQSGSGMAGRETAVNGKSVACNIDAFSTTASCSKADVSQIIVNERFKMHGVYESQ